MNMRNLAILAALVLSGTALAQTGSDWTPIQMDPVSLAQKCEATFKTFEGVDGATSVKVSYEVGKGNGYFGPMWRSTKVFKLDHPVYQNDEVKRGITREWIVSDGTGRVRRLGATPGAVKITPKDSAFNAASDATLVQGWPKKFFWQLYSSFIGGNATLTRYVSALKKGVGGYKVRVDQRILLAQGRKVRNFRIFADRAANGKSPASRVEIIFDANIGLPVNIHTTEGKNDFQWLCRWRNNQKFANKEFQIAK